MLDAILSPSWTATFGISLSLALFAVKSIAARSPKFDDMVVALADIPTVLTASAFSLLVAAISQSAIWRIPGTQSALLVVIFLVNVAILRFVENRKRSLGSEKWKVSLSIAVSLALSILISFNLASAAYLEMGK